MPELECEGEENGTAPFGIRKLLSLLSCPEAHPANPSVTMQIRPIKRLTPAERDAPTSFLSSLALCFSWH